MSSCTKTHEHVTKRKSRMVRGALVKAVTTHVWFSSESDASKFYWWFSKKMKVIKVKITVVKLSHLQE